MKTHLTQTSVTALKPKDKPYWVTDGDCKNLRLYIGVSGKVWYVAYQDERGKYQSHKIGPADSLAVAQAREMARDFISRLRKGENPQKKKRPAKLSLGAFLTNDYERWALTERKSGEQTLYLLRLAFKPFLNKPIRDLNIRTMEKWRQDKMSSGTKAATCNRRLTALKAALNWGVKRDLIESNPLIKLDKLKELDSDAKVRYLADDERKRLYAALDSREKRMRGGRMSHNEWSLERGYKLMPALGGGYADHLKPMVLISLNTGMRQGNLFALKWGDIDFESRTIILRAAASKAGKTSHIPMNSVTQGALVSWRDQSGDAGKDALVFPSPRTGGMLNNVKKAWAGVLKEAGIENFRWHDMRHDFASQLVMKGVDLNRVRELMGHSDL
ncbi:MAG: site-specific integrase [Synergistaceae bacterium]|jgi:integrase|nr:site-specific integrase [Synergistaceae bacterium]